MITEEQLDSLKELAKSRDYGSGPAHSKQVEKLSLTILQDVVKLGLLKDSARDRKIISAAALLHNIGLPAKKHNEGAFDILKSEIPDKLADTPLAPHDFSDILYCILWHRGNTFKRRDDIKIVKRSHLKKLASIMRVADAMDRSFEQIIEDVTVKKTNNSLAFGLKSKYPMDAEKERAYEKADLLIKAFNLDGVSFDGTRTKRYNKTVKAGVG
jgi:exopolyphosphatase / guanosine-5'-triphosphate,3'-diphosphate pyrophosphatase